MNVLFPFFVISGLVVSAISIPLIYRRIPPNGLYGFRVRKTLENPHIWYEANAYAGRRLFIFGLLVALASVGLYFLNLSLDAYALSVLGVMTAVFAVVLAQCIRYLQRL